MRPTLLVLAAGLGSRFGGSKQLEPLGPAGETLLEYSVHDALRAGFGRIVFLIQRSMEADFSASVLSRLPAELPLHLAFQEREDLLDASALAKAGLLAGRARADGLPPRRKPWGTGHALLCAEEAIDSAFALINADDWYGPAAFEIARGFLSRAEPSGMEHCMVGYRLFPTTSGNGPVSRGLCEVDADRMLLEVTEHSRILRRGETCVSTQPDGSESVLASDALVSMNLWGFTPAIFAFARPLFAAFIEEEAASNTAEFLLPSIVNEMVGKKAGRVRVLPTDEGWMGMTYRDDIEAIRARIAALHAEGIYATPLWSGTSTGASDRTAKAEG